MLYMIASGFFCGALLGFVMQRGRFCLTGGFRDMYLTKDYRMFIALLIAISVQSIGVYALIALDFFQFNAGGFSWAATILGSFTFGIGIVMAGGCATGTWYRAGEGLIGSWIALFAYMLSSAVMRAGNLATVSQSIKSIQTPTNSIADTLSVPVWGLISLLAGITAFLSVQHLRKPKISIACLPAKRNGLPHLLFEKRWHPFVTAALIGMIAVAAWPLSALSGRIYGLGITTPSANILQYLITGNDSFINWGVFLVLGIFSGSYIAARGSREFRLRAADAATSRRSFLGGLLMGFGASLAGGCSIGNGLVMTAMMTWQGWISLLFTILGVWSASYVVYVRRPMAPPTALATARA